MSEVPFSSSRTRPSAGALAVLTAAAMLLIAVVGVGRAEAASKAPIVIGNTCDCSGSVASSVAGWKPAFAVWAKWQNARGGILGHKVQVIDRDTKSLPTTGLTAAKELLGNKKVVAMVPGSPAGVGLAPTINAAKAPVIGGLGDDPLWFTNKYVFPVSTTPNALANAIAKIAVTSTKNKKIGDFYCAEVAACKQSLPLFESGAKRAGGEVVYAASISAGSPDYTATCLAAKAKGVGAVWIAGPETVIERVTTNCAKNGFKPQYVFPNFYTGSLKVPALNGAKYAFGDALFNSKAAGEFQSAVNKYDPKLRSKIGYGQYSFQAWLSGKLIARAIEAAKPKGSTVTRADVFRGLYKLRKETLGGAAPPMTFRKGKPTTLSCAFVAQIKNAKLVGGTQQVC